MRGCAIVVTFAACIADPTIPCGEERCPSNMVCTPAGCAAPAAVEACNAKLAGDECMTTAIERGTCGDGVCRPVVCGDSLVDLDEVCDDGNVVPGDLCSATCNSREDCGNGIVDLVAGEQCDSGLLGLAHDGCASLCSLETMVWSDISPQPIPPRRAHGLAYDSVRNRLVVFAGFGTNDLLGDTWEWNGTWIPIAPLVSPSPRYGHVMVFDPARGRVVVYGGFDRAGNDLNDTWTWEGATWTEHQVPSPPGRRNAAAAYDSTRQRVVLFGGVTNNTTRDDTWEWDGQAWIELLPTTRPQSRERHAMGYDATRDRIVVYGGLNGGHTTWELDRSTGTTWVPRTPATTQPTTTIEATMTFDPVAQRLVMFGGFDTNGAPTAAQWEWDGSDWVLQTPQPAPGARVEPRMAWHAGMSRIMLFGGYDIAAEVTYGDTWRWNGNWAELPADATEPSPRAYHATAYDSIRGRGVFFGGFTAGQWFADTWEWTDGRWLQRTPVTVPPGRSNQGMVFDSDRNRTVMFGGYSPSTVLADTWEWDGTNWTPRTTTTTPPARGDFSLTYDSVRKRVVLFGGLRNGVALADTWELDGNAWVERTPSVSPPGRYASVVTYDPVRERVVMFGGFGRGLAGTVPLADTWEWDGQAWIELHPQTSPVARGAALMTYDPLRQRVVLFGGFFAAGFDDTWEWNGQNWTLLPTSRAPVPRGWSHSMFFDAIHKGVVVFGGLGYSRYLVDTWLRRFEDANETVEGCKFAAVDDDGDDLAGCADPDCWGRCAPLCPPELSCPTSAARCGDGACGPVEDALLCPTDC